ncbi:MAG: sugar transferase [Gammaproteobacteria bacterium]|nr:sugar transferase [Gammaproteobacteria bacterium]MDH3468216.1 sugar transferase [Gammaproteobacteria bacterium]
MKTQLFNGRRAAGSGSVAPPRWLSAHSLGMAAFVRCRFKTMVWSTTLSVSRFVKRAIDIAASAVLLGLLLPLFLIVAAAIKLESSGPILFRQTRVGQYGKLFSMWKFRSMYTDADARKQELAESNNQPGGIRFKLRFDPRITKVGRFIRRASIDELPQLWNVFTGSMSLVGPRPPLPDEVNRYSQEQRKRLAAKPGITCTWQISGRADIPFEQQVQLDIQYIASQSLGLDLRILFKTMPAVLSANGAY